MSICLDGSTPAIVAGGSSEDDLDERTVVAGPADAEGACKLTHDITDLSLKILLGAQSHIQQKSKVTSFHLRFGNRYSASRGTLMSLLLANGWWAVSS